MGRRSGRLVIVLEEGGTAGMMGYARRAIVVSSRCVRMSLSIELAGTVDVSLFFCFFWEGEGGFSGSQACNMVNVHVDEKMSNEGSRR